MWQALHVINFKWPFPAVIRPSRHAWAVAIPGRPPLPLPPRHMARTWHMARQPKGGAPLPHRREIGHSQVVPLACMVPARACCPNSQSPRGLRDFWTFGARRSAKGWQSGRANSAALPYCRCRQSSRWPLTAVARRRRCLHCVQCAFRTAMSTAASRRRRSGSTSV